MATAPRPGQQRKEQAQRKAVRISTGTEVYEISNAVLGPADSLECRKQTGMPLDVFFNAERFGADAIVALIWIARRKNGEPGLTFNAVLNEFPSFDDFEKMEVTVVEDAEDDDPSS